MKTLVKKMLFACAFPVLFSLCLFSCADSLNEKNPEKSEELVETGGISWPKEDSSSLVHNCSSGYYVVSLQKEGSQLDDGYAGF